MVEARRMNLELSDGQVVKSFDEGWDALLDGFGMSVGSREREVANLLCVHEGEITISMSECLRGFFIAKGGLIVA